VGDGGGWERAGVGGAGWGGAGGGVGVEEAGDCGGPSCRRGGDREERDCARRGF